jgi:hypothetical protein
MKIILALALTVLMLAPKTASALDIGTSARSMGLGKSFTGIYGAAECVFGNPAGLFDLKRPELFSMYTDLSGDMRHTLVGMAAPAWSGAIGLGYAGSKSGDIFATMIDPDTGRPVESGIFNYGTDNFFLNYAGGITGDLSYGLRLKYVKKGGSIASAGEGTAVNLDAGLIYRVKERAAFGLAVENVAEGGFGAMKWSGGEEEIPRVISLGGVYSFENIGTSIFSDISLRKTIPPEFRFGCEWNPWKSLDLRAGMENLNAGPEERYTNYSVGVGYGFDSFRADYAYYIDTMLSYNSRHYISISFGFPESRTKGFESPLFLKSVDRTITTFESIVLRGGVATGEIVEVCWNGNHAAISDEGSFEISSGFIPGKNKISITGRDKDGIAIGSVEARVLRLMWYRDIARLPWAAEPIMYMTTLGIHGFRDMDARSGFFRPEEPVTRAEMAVILSKADGHDPGELSGSIASDVQRASWYASCVDHVLNKGFMTLYSDGTFKPARRVNRAEGIAMITRFAGHDAMHGRSGAAPYKDVPLNYWGAGVIDAAKKAGYLDYVTGDMFFPGANFTRGEAFYVLSRTDSMLRKTDELMDFDKGY